MRAALDTALLTCWLIIALALVTWTLAAIIPDIQQYVQLIGRIIIVGLPLLSAYRVHVNYAIRWAPVWAVGLWITALVALGSKFGPQYPTLHQEALIYASLAFILIPYPMQRVWGELVQRLKKK